MARSVPTESESMPNSPVTCEGGLPYLEHLCIE